MDQLTTEIALAYEAGDIDRVLDLVEVRDGLDDGLDWTMEL